MTEYYRERYEGECRCGHEITAILKYKMGKNSPPNAFVRCAESGDITNTRKVRE